MTRRTASTLLCLSILASLTATIPARAAFHFMKIREVFGSAAGSANAQFIELQMYSAGQNQVQGHTVGVYNNVGVQVGAWTFPAAVPNSANQSSILVATVDAQTYFGVTADLLMTPVIQQSGGAACFDNIDCVSWGNFTGTLPSAAGAPFNAGTGLITGQSAERKISGGSSATQLDAGDDTNNSATDFQAAVPSPRNNAGQTGSAPSSPIFGADSYQTSETASSVTINVVRADTTQAATVNYSTLNGTATAGQDYTATSGSLPFAVGEGTKTFNVPILDDGAVDADEAFTVRLDDGATTLDTAAVVICGNLPGTPRTLTATASGQNTINLAWQAPQCTGSSSISAYKIYSGATAGSLSLLATVAPSPTTYSDSGLQPGTTRFYKVSAVNGSGESAQSNQAQATTASNDTQNPSVTFSTPPNSVIVAGSPAVAGIATDNIAVTSVSATACSALPQNAVTGSTCRSVTATVTNLNTDTADFVVPTASLLPGPYTIIVTAKDASGRSGNAQILVVHVSG